MPFIIRHSTTEPRGPHKESAEFVRAVRRTLDISQADLADLLLVRVTTVGEWEAGVHRPARKYVARLSQLAGDKRT
jgi:DNA-binding transcriptional regulator YiaG